jgi:Recombination endonuclease VII
MRQTHCKHGHALSGENLYLSPKGSRGCRKCRSANAVASHQRSPELRKKYGRDWMRKQRVENPDRIRGYYLGFEYEMTVDEYKRKVEAQKNCCAICHRLMDRPCVDHDHDTKTVRDLLCKNCNCALGLFQDDALIVAKAAEYLKEWKSHAPSE